MHGTGAGGQTRCPAVIFEQWHTPMAWAELDIVDMHRRQESGVVSQRQGYHLPPEVSHVSGKSQSGIKANAWDAAQAAGG